MVKLKSIFVLRYFIKTILVGFIESLLFLAIRDIDFIQMLWEAELVRPAMVLGLVAIPLILAIKEYQENKKFIEDLFR